MIKDKISYLIRRYRIYLERGKSIPALSLTTTTCKHCGTEYRGNYCPRCGQSHKAGSYRNKKMYKTFREAYPMLSNAFFRTIIELITRPGYMIRDYFRGHQVIYLGPVTTLVVAISCITICGHIYDEIELSSFPKKEITQPQVDSSGKTEKEIYKKWGLTITSKDDGRMETEWLLPSGEYLGRNWKTTRHFSSLPSSQCMGLQQEERSKNANLWHIPSLSVPTT